MTGRRKLTLDAFFDRITAELRYAAPSPRRRIRGDEGLLIWRKAGCKAGVIVAPSINGAYVFLRSSRVQIDSVTQAVAILEAIFAGEVIEVMAEGRLTGDAWLARADAPGLHINTYDRSKSSVEVPVFHRMTHHAWPD